MADETKLMKQLNVVDKNNVTHEFEVKDAKAREEISAAKNLNFNTNQFNVADTSSAINVSISANNENQGNYLRGDGTWFDLDSKKQDVLSAGDGIAITNDVVSHSIKVIENNSEEDTIEDTIMTVYLKNNYYKVITLDPTVTEIHFWITETDSNVLQETGFEFQVPTNSVLTDLEFRVIDNENIKIYTIIPKTYKTPNIYQGTIVNYRCTIGEYKVE
jgi:hypothetical protein